MSNTEASNGLSAETADGPPMYHKIFVTASPLGIDPNETFPPVLGDFGGFAAADWTCTYYAFLAGMVSDWDGVTPVFQAILSTSDANARDRNLIEGAVISTSGETVAADSTEFWSGFHSAMINYDENGSPVPANSPVWTGTSGDGTWSGQSCDKWNDQIPLGTVGTTASATSAWTEDNTRDCALSARLYCISPAMVVPEPSSFILLTIGAVGLLAYGWRRRFQRH